jgi:hypothetical protein
MIRDFLTGQRFHKRKIVIENDVERGSDMTCSEIKNQRDTRCMVLGTPKVYTHPAALFPARYTIAGGVQAIIEDNDRAAKWMVVGK